MSGTLLQQVYQHPLISDAELEQIVRAHKKVSYSKGDYLLEEGKIADRYLVLEKGLIRSFAHNYDNEDVTTDFFSSGEVVIEVLSLFQQIPSPENLQALCDCEGWEINFEIFQQLFHSIAGFSEWGRLWMTRRVFHYKQRAIETATVAARERYLKLLREKPEIIRHAPLKQIAVYLGVTDSSLSRIRKEV